MKKVIKYILSSFLLFFMCININVNALNVNNYNDNIQFLDSIDDTADDDFDSGKYFFMEIFCGVIGVFMVILSFRATDND